MMQQFLEGALRTLLSSQGLVIPQQGFTLEHVPPSPDRVDAQLSHLLQSVCSVNLLTAVAFNVARPIVDTTLSKSLKAISAGSAKVSKVQSTAKSTANKAKTKIVGHVFLEKASKPLTRKRRAKNLKAKDQIIDAEFEMVKEKR